MGRKTKLLLLYCKYIYVLMFIWAIKKNKTSQAKFYRLDLMIGNFSQRITQLQDV